jgi:hypothetical protein
MGEPGRPGQITGSTDANQVFTCADAGSAKIDYPWPMNRNSEAA